MREIIILCYFEIGLALQTIHIVQEQGTKTIKNIPLPQLVDQIIELCNGFETEQVELFGIEEYIKDIKYQLILKNKNLKVGVNRHEIFN